MKWIILRNDNLILGHLKKEEKRKLSNRNNVYIEDTTDEMYDDEDEDLDSNYDSKSIPKQPISSSLIIKSTFTPPPPTVTNLSQSVTKHDQNNEDEIENEIDKLRIENKKNNKSKNISIKHNGSDNTVDTLVASGNNSSFNSKKNLHHKNLKDENLLSTSLKAANNFDKKLHEIENYSQIIENATLNMDACVKDMNIVYENYDNKLRCESSSVEDLISKQMTIANDKNIGEIRKTIFEKLRTVEYFIYF